MSDESQEAQLPPITSLNSAQRRVLGTMIEKALTVPESYPLTLKALTTGCNQKSSRHPLTNYSEDDVEDTLTQLRELGLAAVVHTESGRTERFRHYVRRRFSDLSEPQVAILGELLLRGRQPMGELRSRASRMAPAGSLDSLDQLRTELAGLMSMKFAQSDAALERRGVEIDHNLYEARESKKMAQRTTFDDDPPPAAATLAPPASPRPASVSALPVPASPPPSAPTSELLTRIAALETACAGLRAENRELREQLEDLRQSLDDLRQALGA